MVGVAAGLSQSAVLYLAGWYSHNGHGRTESRKVVRVGLAREVGRDGGVEGGREEEGEDQGGGDPERTCKM